MYAYYDSIIQYLVLFVSLGTLLYGSREIGYIRGDVDKEKQLFYEILLIRLIITIFLLCGIFLLYILNYEFNKIFFIFLINVFSALIDVTFYYQGIGEFKTLAIRGASIKLVSCSLILVLVNKNTDFNLYIFINVLSIFFANLWLYVDAKKKLSRGFFKFSKAQLIKRLYGILRLFLMQVSITIYMYLGKTILGYFSSTSSVGFYDIGYKIIFLILTLNSAIGSVIMPDISNLIENKLNSKVGELATRSLAITLYLMIPIYFFLNLIVFNVISLFFGSSFSEITNIVYVLSLILLVAPVGNVIGIQVLVPMKKELLLTIAPFIGLIVNILFNFLLTPKFGHIGASITSVLTELAGTIFVVILYGKIINIKYLFKSLSGVFFISLFSFIITILISSYFAINILGDLILKIVLMSGMIFFSLLLSKNPFFYKILNFKK